MLRLTKQVGTSALGATLAHPQVYRQAEAAAETALPHLPRRLLYNPLNPWGKHRDVPAAPGYTFRNWYLENRSRK